VSFFLYPHRTLKICPRKRQERPGAHRSVLLTKEDLILKLNPLGVKTLAGINGLIRDQGLPAKYLTARKVFFDEAEIDIWLKGRTFQVVQTNRKFQVVQTNTEHAKVLKTGHKPKTQKKTVTTAAAAEGPKVEIETPKVEA
jgi:hypothetical protein